MLSISLIAVLAAQAFASPDTRELSHFPTVEDVLPTARAQKLLQQARVDFERCRRRQKPKYARLWVSQRDGGTCTYTNTGYIVTAVRRLEAHNDTRTFSLHEGPSIKFSFPITRHDVSYSEIRYIP